MSNSYRTVIVGFGGIAYKYQLNNSFHKEYPVPTHYSALKNNDKFNLDTIVDLNEQVVIDAQQVLKIPYAVKNLLNIPNRESVDIVAVTSPPSARRIDILKTFPNLKGVILEKPLGMNLNEIMEMLSYVEKHNIHVQVSYLRRADEFLIALQNGGLEDLIGIPIKADITYCNGLKNNGSHLIDLVRMLLGDIDEIMFARVSNVEGITLKEDKNISSFIRLNSGIDVSIQPVDLNHYRENSLDIWGTRGRLVMCQEGSYFQYWKISKSRFGGDYKGEIDWAKPDEIGQTKIGYSLAKIYNNLLDAIEGKDDLLSPIKSALSTERVIMEMFEISSLAK